MSQDVSLGRLLCLDVYQVTEGLRDGGDDEGSNMGPILRTIRSNMDACIRRMDHTIRGSHNRNTMDHTTLHSTMGRNILHSTKGYGNLHSTKDYVCFRNAKGRTIPCSKHCSTFQDSSMNSICICLYTSRR